MQFWKVDENTFQCMVTTEDLQSAGMQIIDIITDKDKLSGLLFAVLQEAEQEIGYNAGTHGIIVSFCLVNAGSVVLTFHTCEEGAVCDRMLQKVSPVPGNTLTAAAGDIYGYSSMYRCTENEMIFCFKSFKDLERYASAYPFDTSVVNTVYKDDANGIYYLCFDIGSMNPGEIDVMLFFTLEYAVPCSGWNNFHRYCDEHFTCLIKSNALEKNIRVCCLV
ncbi:MAG: adaptor protein MecA [Lachnospiraceae bacterium]|nr:adaptor protein MecA [Lachnospiraceae bacterium]